MLCGDCSQYATLCLRPRVPSARPYDPVQRAPEPRLPPGWLLPSVGHRSAGRAVDPPFSGRHINPTFSKASGRSILLRSATWPFDFHVALTPQNGGPLFLPPDHLPPLQVQSKEAISPTDWTASLAGRLLRAIILRSASRRDGRKVSQQQHSSNLLVTCVNPRH